MKTILFKILASQTLFAGAKTDCSFKAAQAAMKVARPNGNNPNSSVYASVSVVRLTKRFGSVLYYKVDVVFDITDGYSDTFQAKFILWKQLAASKFAKLLT